MTREHRQDCLIPKACIPEVPDSKEEAAPNVHPSLRHVLPASARFHLSKITASSFNSKIEVTIFNKWNASTSVPQVMSLCRNNLFFLGIGTVG